MKTNRLLAGTLALVLIAGLAILPAFAQVGTDPIEDSEGNPILLPADANPEDIVYENGEALDAGGGLFINSNLVFYDFELTEDTAITDFHFILGEFNTDIDPLRPINYFVRADDGGQPGDLQIDLLGSGTATNVEIEQISDSIFGERWIIWFDFEEPIPLAANTKYWIAVQTGTLGDSADALCNDTIDFSIGDTSRVWFGGDPNNAISVVRECWFQITDKEEFVGGELLPIDSTALVLAGLQTSAIWMLPVLAGVAGSAFGILYIKSRRN